MKDVDIASYADDNPPYNLRYKIDQTNQLYKILLRVYLNGYQIIN